MQLYATVFATLFITSSVLATAIPDVADEADIDLSPVLLNATESTAVEDGVPDFDPLELTGPLTIRDERKRDPDVDDIGSALEKRPRSIHHRVLRSKPQGNHISLRRLQSQSTVWHRKRRP
jgi:hypothetical protein